MIVYEYTTPSHKILYKSRHDLQSNKRLMKSDLNPILEIPNYMIKRASGIMCKALNLLIYVTQTSYTKEQIKSKTQLHLNTMS